MFQLERMTKVRVLDIRTLSSKDRKPGELPGAQLLLSANLPSEALSMFDGVLPAVLFRRADATQGALEGMETSELTAVGDHVKRLNWHYEQTGCLVVIDYGTGGSSNISLSDCKAHRVSLSPRQGGSVVVQWAIDALGLSDETRGKLTGLKSTETELTMVGPEIAQQPLIDAGLPEKKKPKAAAAPAPAPAADEKGPWPFGDKGAANEPNTKTPETALADAATEAASGETNPGKAETPAPAAGSQRRGRRVAA